METDSDYCSNDSDANFHSSSRTNTSTSPKTKLEVFKCLKLNYEEVSNKIIIGKNDLNTPSKAVSKNVRNMTFLVGKSEERMELQNFNPIVCKAPILASHIRKLKSLEMKIEEWEPHVFKVFLEYLKTDVFKASNFSDYVQLIRLCVAYEVPKLLAQVCPLVKRNITLDNGVELYKLAASKDLDDLRGAAYNFLLRAGSKFLEHPTFMDLDCITLSILVSSDDFPIVEIALFNRLKDWVTEQCKRLNYPPDRKEFFGRVAGLLFLHVRYAQMTPKEFRNDVLPSGLLSQKDIEAINLRHRTHPGLWYTLPPCNFVDRPRMTKLQFSVPLYNNVQIGFRKIAGATSSVIQESVRFMVSHDIYLTGIGFFGPAKSDRCVNGFPLTAYTIKIQVEGDYSKHFVRCPAQNATIISRDNFSIELTQPLRIQKLEPHKLTVWIDGEVTQFGVFPLPQAIVLLQDRGEIITFHFGDADSDPQPNLEASGMPSSSAPTLHQTHLHNRHHQYKHEPRMSGVIRCISFLIKDR